MTYPVPTGYTVVAPLPLLEDLPHNEMVNYIRAGLRVIDNGKRLQVETITGGYRFHFNKRTLASTPEDLKQNIGYTYIRQTKLSKQDILRYYGGSGLIQLEVQYSTKPVVTMNRGGAAALFRKMHNKK